MPQQMITAKDPEPGNSIVTTFLLLIQVLVEQIIANSVSDTINNSQVIPLSMRPNETEIIIDQRQTNLNVTVIAYSDEDAEGNERNTHINNTFNSLETIPNISSLNSTKFWSSNNSSIQLSSSEFTISYSQLFETTLASNVNDVNYDKVSHKWNNESNETIDGFPNVSTSFEHNSTSESNSNSSGADDRLKLFELNQPNAGIRVGTPNKTDANIENSHKSWPKLDSNVVLDEKTNESHKSINTYRLVIENIAKKKSIQMTAFLNTSILSIPSMTSKGLNQNRDNKTRIKYSDKSVEKQNINNSVKMSDRSYSERESHTTDQSLIVITTESSGNTTTTSPSIDYIFTTISSSESAQKSAYSTQQLIIPTATDSTALQTDIGQDIQNVTDSMNNTTHGLEEVTTTQTHPLRPTVAENSLSVTTATNQRKHFNVSEQYIDIQYDDNESIQVYRRCHSEPFNDVNWTSTETATLASQSCPLPYSGTVYRPCYPSGQWGEPDYSECRLEHLREIQSLILYHVHKHLVDGLYPLAEDLSRLVTSGRFPIRSPMDRLDAIDALNAILRAKIKIRMEDEEKNLNLIQSLTTICDQVLTRTKVVFTLETEKNALITQKTAEALFGFRLLSENILRALIVVCDDGTIRRIKPIVPDSKNIIMTLTHRTPFGSLLPLVTPSNYTTLMNSTIIPRVIIHLEDFNKLGVGISSVWIQEIGKTLDNSNYEVISDIILVSVVPAVSIEVDFEETPKVEVELKLKRNVRESDTISCGRIRSARDLWLRKGCETLARNLSSIHCLCNELGIIAALIHKTSFTDSSANNSGHNHSILVHTFVLYISFTASLLLLVISLLCQIVQRSRESREASFILISLVSSLIAIQLTFISGAPFHSSWSKSREVCTTVPLLFHLVHLISAFWMLSHTVFLYQRLWRPISRSSLSSLPSETHSSLTYSCCPNLSSRSSSMPFSNQWDCKQFFIFATLLPALSVLISYYLNPDGYETKRYCWLSIEGGMQYSFIVPVSILIMTNTVIMLLVLKRFFETKPLTHKIEIDKTQPALRAGVTLLPFFAVNWFLSVLALEDTATTAFQCIFAASNLVLSYLVFLFHCYQRYDLNDYIKLRIFRTKKHQKSSLRLKKNSYPGRGLRVDIPRLCIGEDRDSVVIPIAANSGSSIDCQPLLMPYSGSSVLSSPPKPNQTNSLPKE